MNIVLYSAGGGSNRVVAHGIAAGLRGMGRLAAHVELGEDADDVAAVPADCGLYVGPWLMCGALRRGGHCRRAVLVQPNSTYLPEQLLRLVEKHATDVVAPSSWAAERCREAFGTSVTISVYQHGVDGRFAPDYDASRDGGPVELAHVSSSMFGRKGTEELVLGWMLGRDEGEFQNARLTLAMVPAAIERLRLLLGLGHDVERRYALRLEPCWVRSPMEYATWLKGFDLVVQPSRGEAFGLVPLEALCAGVPIVATDVSGHTEWAGDVRGGAVWVRTGGLEPIDDGPGALAPSLDPMDVMVALREAVSRLPELRREAREEAAQLRERWSWEAVTARWLAQVDPAGGGP